MKLKIIGDVRQEYRIGRKLGAGNFGQVFEAMHTRTDVECAVKVIDKVKLK